MFEITIIFRIIFVDSEVEAVLAFLQDQHVDGNARCHLATGAIASFSENPDAVEAVLTLLQQEKMNEWSCTKLASRACQHCAKWLNKTLVFLDSLFFKDCDVKQVSTSFDIPMYVILPLYEKTHEKGRQYIKAQLVKHHVLVYDRAGTILLRQAGQTERISLSLFISQQIKQAHQSSRLTFDSPASTVYQQRFFSTSTNTNSSLIFRSIKSCFFL